MKLNRILTMCAVAATLIFSAASALAQDNGGGGGGGGQGGDQGGGGQRRFRGGGGGGGGNFDPAQMQQRIMDNLQDALGFTNDTDWDAVKPLVQKVLDAQRDAGNANVMRAMFRNRQRQNGDQGGGNQGGGNNQRQRGGGFFGQQSAEQTALQQAIDDNAPTDQIKDLLAKAKTAQKAKQEALEQAKANLKSVLTGRQEAQAYLYGLVD